MEASERHSHQLTWNIFNANRSLIFQTCHDKKTQEEKELRQESFASRHVFDHLSMGLKFLPLWLMLLCKQKVPYSIGCAEMKAFLLTLPLLLRWFTYKAKNLVLPSPAESALGDVIAFSERYLLHEYSNSLLSKKLNVVSGKGGATSSYCGSCILTDTTAKRKGKTKPKKYFKYPSISKPNRWH